MCTGNSMESERNAKLLSTLVFFFWHSSKTSSKIYIHVPYILSASSSHTNWQAGEHKSCFAKRIFSSKCEWQYFYLICSQIQWNHLLLEKELKRQVWKYKSKLCKIIIVTCSEDFCDWSPFILLLLCYSELYSE